VRKRFLVSREIALSLEKVPLRKLLEIFYASPGRRTHLLRTDIRNQIRKEGQEDDEEGGGGHFQLPFWADAKAHVKGVLDLSVKTESRIAKNKGRARLYRLLANGFLSWWNEKRRWRNEAFVFIPRSVKEEYAIDEVECIVRVENTLEVTVGRHRRVIYPYFCETILSEEAARIGLWLLTEALDSYDSADLRILDIIRGASYSRADLPFQGNERAIFVARYKSALVDWERLRDGYN
jgi:hypothetical protein